MQIIIHKNSTLTVSQRLFIEKSLELLYIGSIDSYRVKLNNPKTVVAELKYCLTEFNNGRIKHFQTIKAKDKDRKAIVDEVIDQLANQPNYLSFTSISQKYFDNLLKTIDEHNYKKVISSADILLSENSLYLQTVLDGIETIIQQNDANLNALEQLDKALSFLYSELISAGFSKGYLYRLVYGIFVNSLASNRQFDDHFQSFRHRILESPSNYNVIFRIDTTQKVFDAISTINHPILSLTDNIDDVILSRPKSRLELSSFNAPANARKFIRCSVEANDYITALKKARSIVSDYLDVINLGLSDEFLQIHSRALVIDTGSPQGGDFQNNVNILDGKYRVEKDHYLDFTRKLPAIINNFKITHETKEKIKSAVRYLRLGNQSTEVEHKFINYWIGLEYLFSNYESQNTINRLKEHFVNAHLLAYVKRNVYSLRRSTDQLSAIELAVLTTYDLTTNEFLKTETFYQEIADNFIRSYPLLAYRASKLKKWFFTQGKPANATNYLQQHKTNLEIHFTRIYRLRNEIIHDAATNTNNEQIASNLRYYLTFILNELIDFLSTVTIKETSIEDYFILNEIRIGNISQNGYLLNELLDVSCSISFIS